VGITVTTTYTCDRCGASATGLAPPDGSARLDYTLYRNGPEIEGTKILCPSCTEAVTTLLNTPPN
jgi:hypothetical protein